ncbi:MAG: hypothetical protein Q7T11_10065 [Deltaproteobacteria bacterium]|nr:hypothetical protein [Deltaproteobacteria bacterium]
MNLPANTAAGFHRPLALLGARPLPAYGLQAEPRQSPPKVAENDRIQRMVF